MSNQNCTHQSNDECIASQRQEQEAAPKRVPDIYKQLEHDGENIAWALFQTSMLFEVLNQIIHTLPSSNRLDWAKEYMTWMVEDEVLDCDDYKHLRERSPAWVDDDEEAVE